MATIDVAMESTSQNILEKLNNVNASVARYMAKASNNVQYTLLNTEKSAKIEEVIATAKVVGIFGTVRLTYTLRCNANRSGGISVVKNGDTTIYSSSVNNQTTYKTITKDIQVVDGDVLEFKLVGASNAYNGYCNLITFSFDVEELNENTFIIGTS